tara:strand:- start:873 stop:2729 length:1857 start_codon:yes stop_codon:yes gene_type:complete
MRDTMTHRGPDGAGAWFDDNLSVGIGHRRLSIVDLSTTASQPMESDDGRYILTFNGEIYNHVELRDELKALGVSNWYTDHSDTEVLLKAFQVWGLDCVHKFRGMFAFAIWDKLELRLTLVRDRIGIKPLYWAKRDGRFSFASEIKGLLADPDQKREMDEEALFHYLAVMTTPAPLTMFAGIKKLAPGTIMTVNSAGDVNERRYWDVWDDTNPFPDDEASEGMIAEAVLGELETAVKYRKVADVPAGVFLSGGIDSSTNAALFARGETDPIKTFSIGYEHDYGSYKNELNFAASMAQNIGADHHELRLTQDDLINFVPKLIELQDEPIADPVCVPVYYVSKLARDHGVTVCQVGEGADEVFWGYPWWKQLLSVNKLTSLPLPKWAFSAGQSLLSLRGWKDHKVTELFRRRAQGEPFFYSGAETFTHYARERLLSPRMREKFRGRSTAEALTDIIDRYEKGAWEKTPLNWMSYVDLNLRLPELLLMRVDKMSMGVSLECRVPFLDHKFVACGMSIPTKTKMRNGELKHILKRAVTGLIPDEIIHRKKQGFGVPIHEWFQDRLGAQMKQEIYDFCRETDVFDISMIDELFSSNDGIRLWWIYNLAAWHRHFIRRQPIESGI